MGERWPASAFAWDGHVLWIDATITGPTDLNLRLRPVVGSAVRTFADRSSDIPIASAADPTISYPQAQRRHA